MGRLMGVTVNVVLKSFYYAQNWQNIFVSHNPIKYMHDFFLPRSLDFSQLLHTYIVRSLSFSLLLHNSNKRKNNKYSAMPQHTYMHRYTIFKLHYCNCAPGGVGDEQELQLRHGLHILCWPKSH